MEGQSSSGSRRPGTRAGLGPLPVPVPHGVSQTGAPSKVDSSFQLPSKNAAPAPSEPRLALAAVGPRAAVPPSTEGPRLALASPRPILAPLSTPGGQKTAPARRSSSLAPTSVGQLVVSASAGPKPPAVTSGSVLAPTSLGQLVISASAGPRPPPATLRPRLSPTSRDQKQVPPASVGPKPALAASGLSLALASEEQHSQPPSNSSPVPSPVLSSSQEQALAPASVTSASTSVGQTPAKQKAAPAPKPLPSSEAHLQPSAPASGPTGSTSLIQSPPDPRISPSFRARPEAPRSSPEDPVLPRPPQTLPLDVGQGPPEPATRSPGLLSPTFRPGSSSAQTVPPPLPKPPRSPSRSPSRSPNRSPCVPPAPETALPRPGSQGVGHSGHLSPSLQHRETPAPVTTSPSTSTSSSSWSAQPTCKSDPGFWITVVTWNVGTAMPPDDVTSLLHLGSSGDDSDGADMIAIGLQEVNSMINKRLKDALFTDQWSELFMDALAPFNFVLVSTVRMQGVILLLFAKYYHLPFLRDVQTDCTRTGLGGYWGNKGGVSVRLAAFGHMLCFLNCHLPAHMDKAEQRKDNFQTILSLQQFPGPGAHGILDHDLVFWFGDLNFRIESYDLHFVKFAIDSDQLHQLWEKDQLNMAKSTWPILKGFQEGPLNFAPTFKFDVGTNKYDTSAKKRKPAWTDRILWKVKAPGVGPSPSGRESHRLQVTQHSYRSHMEYTVSDHKPVAAQFVLQFAYRDDVPLVRLEVADEWVRPEQAVVRYRIETVFARSSWDWIGLYRVGFRHCKDYVAYVWAKHEDVDGNIYQVTFSEESLPKGHGDFILGYYSHTHSILIGVTEPFQISLPTSELASSSTDSSSASSEDEDDSTLELLAPKSRSPSPGKSKRHRSRSPGLARFPGLALRPSSRERRGASRSPSPQSRRLPRVAPDKGNDGGSRGSSEEGPSGLPGPWAFPPSVPRSLGLLPALRLETVDPGGGGSWGPNREAPAPSSLSTSPQGRQGLEEGGLGP
ncbi:phosphatidylinositol 4,5-bisphosphate 5-phosphatase A isoform 1-T1 [Lycaon pictus]|uniref:Phosphatidylinositol 4,5-bisphosphate 5-phosphatase A n=3 Tax=Canis lupus TaxID=9612 RepID=A0A8C0TL98_CANLF|nr:phosphatidylinositol 4,5-bisphosphate 5-phosphatase A [Canis lupus familiaris]XP_025330372.1 phosphatidylinositol 4,5-bisphosphate 5-phosphatase A [Canis lupus dingo]XP_038293207.1 phosphatidylinositol 4,5-bisphosphate 5-phosphatase A [Canis lupus familiaris]XP_038431605.1 phosphatidylinositol 4,5-bisphosphate 5-phosphatase A [Canis lupus familiaris]|eukprot:XP_013963567.1 phosphatidylinositol 4,5-bisphosphate 5-phosphatase A [Canis lupus familiaris]